MLQVIWTIFGTVYLCCKVQLALSQFVMQVTPRGSVAATKRPTDKPP